MIITFDPLHESHFSLLLAWLAAPHVKKWWDQNIMWDEELIRNKYENYTKGYKVLHLKDGMIITKPIHAFIINYDNKPIGYIQYYNKHDFPSHHGYDSSKLPESCAGIDYYIGELKYTGHGIGPEALKQFLNELVNKKYHYAFVDPELDNLGAIRAYNKAGFRTIKTFPKERVVWMIKNRALNNDPEEVIRSVFSQSGSVES